MNRGRRMPTPRFRVTYTILALVWLHTRRYLFELQGSESWWFAVAPLLFCVLCICVCWYVFSSVCIFSGKGCMFHCLPASLNRGMHHSQAFKLFRGNLHFPTFKNPHQRNRFLKMLATFNMWFTDTLRYSQLKLRV